MDATALARKLFGPIPAHRTLGIEVQWAGDSHAEVTMSTPEEMSNIIGSLHSSGLIALVDAGGLAAIIGACEAEDDLEGITPLGATASLQFHRPARGRLLATCRLDEPAEQALRRLLSTCTDRARLSTSVDIVDHTGALVCQGAFDWSLRRAA